MFNKKNLNYMFFSMVFALILTGCTTSKAVSQNSIFGLNAENIPVNPDAALFGTWTWVQDEDYNIQAVISADTMEYEFHNLGNHSVSVTLSDITWIAEDNSDLSLSVHYPKGYRIQGTVTANSIYAPENAVWPEEIGNIYWITVFPHKSDSQKALILLDELERKS